jgi:hypothetical protein
VVFGVRLVLVAVAWVSIIFITDVSSLFPTVTPRSGVFPFDEEYGGDYVAE